MAAGRVPKDHRAFTMDLSRPPQPSASSSPHQSRPLTHKVRNIEHARDRVHGSPADPVAQLPPARRVFVFTIIAWALFMMSVDTTIVATALHSLEQGLNTSVNWVGWTLTGYSLGFVLMLPISGNLSQQYGHRKVFLGSVAVFTAASLCCGLAGNIYMLVVLRAVQGAGGAGFTPAATGIIVDHFGKVRDRAVSLFGSIFPVGAMIGPIFGGLFVSYWTWRGIFLVNVPIGIAIVALTVRYIPGDAPAAAHKPLRTDATGMALLGIGILAAMLATSYMGERNGPAWPIPFVLLIVIAIIALSMFFHHIKRSSHPFISPRFILGHGFAAVNLVNVLYGGITQGAIALIPLYAADRYQINALESGTLLVAQGIAAAVFSTVVALALRRTGYRLPLYVGCVISAIGIFLLALHPDAGIAPYAWLAGSAFLVGTGSGVINPPCRNAGLQLAPEHSPILAALRSMLMQIGSIVMISAATASLAVSDDRGGTQAQVYIVAALLLIAALPSITRIPNHRGSW